ncbi:MAG: tyrosine-type recombinase/integrase [Thiotrichales bacterium]|nr:tyrosine-type recombinase/integrase [Thiotrichales bacterium]
MSPRRRSANRSGWPDGLRAHTKSDATYYSWIDPRDGSEKSLKAKNDLKTAIKRAKQLNTILTKQADDIVKNIADGRSICKVTLPEFAEIYLQACADRGLKPNTLRTRKSAILAVTSHVGPTKKLDQLTVLDVVAIFAKYTSQNKNRMAQSMRSALIDLYKEATHQGILPAGYADPASATRAPKVKVKRARLILDDFAEIKKHKKNEYGYNAWMLGLVTGQRLDDIAIMQFKKGKDWDDAWLAWQKSDKWPTHPYAHVDGDVLRVVQQKSGSLVEIPLSLKMEAINMSVRDVINMCRNRTVSRYLIHHDKNMQGARRGDPVHANTISKSFKHARDASGIIWPGKTPPTYHELRSLSERLYKAQGVNTTNLLGHKHNKTTAIYHDARAAEWLKISD